MNFFVNGNYFLTLNDPTLVNMPYFGAFTATDEYSGLEARYSAYRVRPLASTLTTSPGIDNYITPADVLPETPFVWPTGQD